MNIIPSTYFYRSIKEEGDNYEEAKFDIPGLFVWHCHILDHEDDEMMRPYEVVGAPSSPNSPVARDDSAIARSRFRFRRWINLLANDTDSDGNRTINRGSVQIVTFPANGSVTVLRGGLKGWVAYLPNAGFTGVDTFAYTVADNQGNISNVATVSVTVR